MIIDEILMKFWWNFDEILVKFWWNVDEILIFFYYFGEIMMKL